MQAIAESSLAEVCASIKPLTECDVALGSHWIPNKRATGTVIPMIFLFILICLVCLFFYYLNLVTHAFIRLDVTNFST